jgi:hypothetical protein
MGDDRRRQPVPALLLATTALAVVSGLWFGATLLGLTPMHYDVAWVVYGAFGWLVFNAGLVGLAVARIRSERFAGERRASVRFELEAGARLGGRPCSVRDLSLTGARVVIPGGDFHLNGDQPDLQTLVLDLGHPLALEVEVRSCRPGPEGTVCGVEFRPGQEAERAGLALALFHSEADPERVPDTGAPDTAPAAA